MLKLLKQLLPHSISIVDQIKSAFYMHICKPWKQHNFDNCVFGVFVINWLHFGPITDNSRKHLNGLFISLVTKLTLYTN